MYIYVFIRLHCSNDFRYTFLFSFPIFMVTLASVMAKPQSFAMPWLIQSCDFTTLVRTSMSKK